MHTLWQDVRFSLRLLARHRGFTVTAVAVLALGIGVNAGIFGLINGLLLRPLPGAQAPGRVVGLYSLEQAASGDYRAFSYSNYADVRDADGPFSQLAAHTLAMAGLTEGETTRRAMVDIVSANFFQTLGVSLALGRTFTAAEERPGSGATVAVASHTYWTRSGLAPDILGQTATINGKAYTIVGVAPRGFSGTTAILEPDFWVPLGAHADVETEFDAGTHRPLDRRDVHRLIVVGRLKPGVTIEQADQALAPIGARLASAFPVENARQQLLVRPLSRLSISTSPSDDRQLYSAVLLLQGLAAVVLLISCLNLANMLLAHGATRTKEIAIRQAIGGGRARLVRQLMTEGLILALAGGAAGLLAAYWGTTLLFSTLSGLLPITLAVDPTPDERVIGATIAFSALATIGFGLWPAWRLSRTDTVRALNDQTGGLGGVRRIFSTGNVLVTAQVALSLALLIVSGLFVRGALAGARTDAGFPMDRTVLAQVDPSLAGMDEARGRDLQRHLLERLRGLPGVEAASSASIVPFGNVTVGRTVQADGPRLRGTDPGAGDKLVQAHFYVVGADYFRTLGIRVIAGREFTIAEEQASDGVVPAIIDEPTARRLFARDNPVGRRLQFSADETGAATDRPIEIVGLVAGTRHELFERDPRPHLYLPFGQAYLPSLNLHVRAAAGIAPVSLVDAIRREVRAASPALPVLSVATLEAHRDRSLALWVLRIAAQVFVVLGLAAAFVAVVGLYGVKSYIVSRRTREFGIRQALGASPGDILHQVFREGIGLTVVGLAGGLALGALLGQGVATFLYQVSPFDPVSFGGAAGVLLGAALIAAWVPARRAGKVAPMAALRLD
jgi:predicted permease